MSDRSAKTYLSISCDYASSSSEARNALYELNGTIYDTNDALHELKVHLWSRSAPEIGAYVLSHFAAATDPLCCFVNEDNNMRLIPEDFDGSDITKPSLPDCVPVFSGIGILINVNVDKRMGIVVGKSFMGKILGWKPYKLRLILEDTPRFKNWQLPLSRSLVSFDALFAGRGADDIIEANVRRILAFGDAPTQLLNELGGGIKADEKGMDKFTAMRKAREARRQKNQNQAPPAPSSLTMTKPSSTDVTAAIQYIVPAPTQAALLPPTQDVVSATAQDAVPELPEASVHAHVEDDISLASAQNRGVDPVQYGLPGQLQTPVKDHSAAVAVPPAPKIARAGHSHEDPASPSPGLLTRKRARGE